MTDRAAPAAALGEPARSDLGGGTGPTKASVPAPNGSRGRSVVGRRLSPYTSIVAILASIALAIVLLLAAVAVQGCATWGLKPAATLKLQRQKATPKDARVTIDEQYVGPLGFVAASGVRLRAGEHRISIEKEGYFPFDQKIEVDGDEGVIELGVQLVPIPD